MFFKILLTGIRRVFPCHEVQVYYTKLSQKIEKIMMMGGKRVYLCHEARMPDVSFPLTDGKSPRKVYFLRGSRSQKLFPGTMCSSLLHRLHDFNAVAHHFRGLV